MLAAAAGAGGVLTATALGSVGVASYFAHRVITPERDQPDDTTIRDVGSSTVTLDADEQTTSPGRYGLWLQRGKGHVRIGEVLSTDAAAGTVTRDVLGVDKGTLATGRGRWSSYYFAGDPSSALGLASEEVLIDGDLGGMPAWLVPGSGGTSGAWAVLVHGRGAQRDECLRALPVLHDLGITALVIGYRNDVDAPGSHDGRYSLGLSEWRDVESALLYAVERGAADITLMGWSMGGAIVLQTLDRSWLSDRVDRVVLDGPVVDWGDVIRHQADLNHLPAPIGILGRKMLSGKLARRLTGVGQPVDVAQTNWVARALELTHPILLIHSQDDDFVPFGPSQALADARPDLVRLERWQVARHCREWNVDPQRWDDVVRDYLS